MVVREIWLLPASKFSHNKEIRLRESIKIVEGESTFRVCFGKNGVYQRHRRNCYTEEEWLERCNKLVSRDNCPGCEDECIGVPFSYFAYGNEGKVRYLIGIESSEAEKECGRRYHDLNRDRHLQQMSQNNERYRIEREIKREERYGKR